MKLFIKKKKKKKKKKLLDFWEYVMRLAMFWMRFATLILVILTQLGDNCVNKGEEMW